MKDETDRLNSLIGAQVGHYSSKPIVREGRVVGVVAVAADEPGIEDLEHEARLMRARNERLEAEVQRLQGMLAERRPRALPQLASGRALHFEFAAQCYQTNARVGAWDDLEDAEQEAWDGLAQLLRWAPGPAV